MAKRRRFSEEFKREAVALANQPGVTKSQVGRELGVNPNLLTRWSRELRAAGTKSFPGAGRPRDEEFASLKRELARTRRERDFLREAAAFFARESK